MTQTVFPDKSALTNGQGVELLKRVRIVLVQPTHPGNVGSVARAMKTMGLSHLVLVNPQDPEIASRPEAVALASGAVDLLEAIAVVPDTQTALSGVQYSLALSARQRELAPAVMGSRQGSQWVLGHLHTEPSAQAALVFGTERSGLTNEDVLLCNRQIMIEANPSYSSLNLSQAVQVLAYELRMHALHGGLTVQADAPQGVFSTPAAAVGNEDIDRLFEHFIQAMSEVDYLNPDRPKKLIPRMRRLLAKAQLEREEVDMLRGFLHDVVRVAELRLHRHEWDQRQSALSALLTKFSAQGVGETAATHREQP